MLLFKSTKTVKAKKDYLRPSTPAKLSIIQRNETRTSCDCYYDQRMKSWIQAKFPYSSIFFIDRNDFENDRKKLNHFGPTVWKYRLMNTVTVSFNTTVRQMTEVFFWPDCLSEKKRFNISYWGFCLRKTHITLAHEPASRSNETADFSQIRPSLRNRQVRVKSKHTRKK